jgi:hypothetical protein
MTLLAAMGVSALGFIIAQVTASFKEGFINVSMITLAL